MGFFDKVKQATGVGLTPEQHYARVYEKAILMGEGNYAKGIDLFEKAAEQATKAGDEDLANRAMANAALYSFVTSGKAEHLSSMLEHIRGMEEIEQVGSQSDMMPTAPLATEIEARLVEARALATGNSASASAEAHRTAANAWKKLGMAKLFTYAYASPDQHKERADQRLFFHLGMAGWHDALASVESTPEGASEHMSKAMSYFKQCNDDSWSSKAETWRGKCRVKRTCWMCDREFQGQDLHFFTYPADLAPYILSVVKALDGETQTLDLAADRLVLCRACGTTIDKLADKWARHRTGELRTEVKTALDGVNNTLTSIRGDIQKLHERLQSCERVKHRHS
jgi:hypothetical protein